MCVQYGCIYLPVMWCRISVSFAKTRSFIFTCRWCYTEFLFILPRCEVLTFSCRWCYTEFLVILPRCEVLTFSYRWCHTHTHARTHTHIYRAKLSYHLLFVASFKKRDALGFSQNILFWRCVSSVRPDWLKRVWPSESGDTLILLKGTYFIFKIQVNEDNMGVTLRGV